MKGLLTIGSHFSVLLECLHYSRLGNKCSLFFTSFSTKKVKLNFLIACSLYQIWLVYVGLFVFKSWIIGLLVPWYSILLIVELTFDSLISCYIFSDSLLICYTFLYSLVICYISSHSLSICYIFSYSLIICYIFPYSLFKNLMMFCGLVPIETRPRPRHSVCFLPLSSLNFRCYWLNSLFLKLFILYCLWFYLKDVKLCFLLSHNSYKNVLTKVILMICWIFIQK